MYAWSRFNDLSIGRREFRDTRTTHHPPPRRPIRSRRSNVVLRFYPPPAPLFANISTNRCMPRAGSSRRNAHKNRTLALLTSVLRRRLCTRACLRSRSEPVCAIVREECVHTRDTGCPLIALLREGSCSSVHEAIPRPRSLLSLPFSLLSLFLLLPPLFSPLFAPTSLLPFPVRATFSFLPLSSSHHRSPEVVAGCWPPSLSLSLSLGFVRIFSSLLPSRFTSFSAVYVFPSRDHAKSRKRSTGKEGESGGERERETL